MGIKPLAIDLFCGLGGWTEGLLAEGYDVVGFDIERHVYGDERYPAQLVLQDVLTLHGRQFKDASLIVASPPCQAYSYRAMPWKRAKALPPPGNSLFDACFRIQREACEAVGRHIPLIVENVRGAIPWVGRSRWNMGAFHLWGDVPALMPMTQKLGVKLHASGRAWFDGGPAAFSSGSLRRKRASAMMAKIPLPLSRHIARVFKPTFATATNQEDSMPTAAATGPLVALNIPRPTEDPNTPANSALALARSLDLHTPEDYQGAARILQDVKGRMGALEKARKAIKQPLDVAVAAVQALFRPPQATLEEAERIIKRKMTDYDEAQRRAAQEAQRKLNEQAERDRQALLKRAEKAQASGKGERALELQERAQAVTAPVVQAATPQVQGVSLRDVAVFEITDPAALPREYLIPDEKRIGAVVRAMGLQANIPGVTVRMEKQVASRSA